MADFHVIAGGTARPVFPKVRKIGLRDLWQSLAAGFDDFYAMPSHIVFIGLIYPIVGIVLTRTALGADVLPLIFPLAAGFALIGPFAAIGLYEMSRRRELGLDLSWWHAFDVFHSPSIGAIGGLAVLLMLIFLGWLGTAQATYQILFGIAPPGSVSQFVHNVFYTEAGWKLIVWGNPLRFFFSGLCPPLRLVSFPLFP